MEHKEKTIRVGIANITVIGNDLISSYLKKYYWIDVCFQSNELISVFDEISKKKPDVAVIHMNIFNISILEEIENWTKKGLITKFILVDIPDNFRVHYLYDSGICGFVNIHAKKEELSEAIHKVYHDNNYFSKSFAESMLKKEDDNDLNTDEWLIVNMLFKGIARKKIAEMLNKSYNTLKGNIKVIFKKAGVHKLTELFVYCLNKGYIYR